MLYHITLLKNIGKILKEGIQPNKPALWAKRNFGRFPKGCIFGCTEYSDAVRWAFKTDWQVNEPHRLRGAPDIPVVIIGFDGNPDEWERDTHIEGAGADGHWIKSTTGVAPDRLQSITLPAKWKEIDIKEVVFKAR